VNDLSALLCMFALICFSGKDLLCQGRSFTVRDDIGLVHFGDPYSTGITPVVVSPDQKLVVVQSEYGSLEDDRLHDELRVYDISQLRRYVDDSTNSAPPEPLWKSQEATNKDGSNSTLIRNIRWLSDSSGFAFLLKNESGNVQLCLAELAPRSVIPLTPMDKDVIAFDIHSRDHYVFTVAARRGLAGIDPSGRREVIVEKGETLYDAAFARQMMERGDRSELWAAVGGETMPIINTQTGERIAVYLEGSESLVLSPDGKSLLIALPVPEIPQEWERKYPPPYKGYAMPITAGSQDLHSPRGALFVSQYADVGLVKGTVTPVTDGPTALRAGWWANFAAPAWSSDERWMVLPGAFVPTQTNQVAIPCVAVRQVSSKDSLECVYLLKRNLPHGAEAGYKRILSATFAPGHDDRMDISYMAIEGTELRYGFMTYQKEATSKWRLESDVPSAAVPSPLRVDIKMRFDESPKLVATNTETGRSKVIWDPNPQLAGMAFGKVSKYQWKDGTGRAWSALLYMPTSYVSGRRYPLVIQNHGFDEGRFSPSGGFPSTFIAQELAGAGIMVLQMRDCAGRGSPQEVPCNVTGYESAVAQLAEAELVDPDNVGIIGFSRTVSYVLAAVFSSKLHFKAASVYDGINLGYFDQVANMGADAFEAETDGMIGGPPYGVGLHKWIERSPEFNMDKVTTPLRIVAAGELGSVELWEPYALLREMHRPVEFVQLQTSEHVITDPAVRAAAQGGNVDWFRFWLQGYRDPEPSKQGEYQRWESIRNSMTVSAP
jgi:hypothetical protein